MLMAVRRQIDADSFSPSHNKIMFG